jgi:GNAT superfamily N-acetyltransferase
MAFEDDDPEQLVHHERRHDEVTNGVHVSADHAEIAWQFNEDCVAVVTPLSSRQEQEMTEAVAQFARLDMHYDGAAFHAGEPWNARKVHMFLYERNKRIIGYARFEWASEARRYTWVEYENNVPWDSNHEALWSVGSLWVNKIFYRTGVATKLLTEAARWLGASQQTIGWKYPFTDKAMSFLRKTYPESLILAR